MEKYYNSKGKELKYPARVSKGKSKGKTAKLRKEIYKLDLNARYPSFYPPLNSFPDILSNRILLFLNCYAKYATILSEKYKYDEHVYIDTELLRDWIGEYDGINYITILEYLEKNSLISIIFKKSKKSEYNQRYIKVISPSLGLPWVSCKFTDSRAELKMFNIINKYSIDNIKCEVRRELIKYVNKFTSDLDLEKMKEDVLNLSDNEFKEMFGLGKKKKVKKINRQETLLLFIDILKTERMYFNSCDEFGHRLHTIFTNTKADKMIEKYLPYKLVNVDFVNSQMLILSLLLKYPDICYNLLDGTLEEMEDFKDTIEEIKLINDYRLEWFIEKSLNGTLYEEVSFMLDVDRKKAKKILFNIVFSGKKDKSYFLKKDIRNSILEPIIIIAEKYNSILNNKGKKKNLISKMMQRLESRLMINSIGGRLVRENIISITIHDGFYVQPENIDRILTIIKEEFSNKIGFIVNDYNLKIK